MSSDSDSYDQHYDYSPARKNTYQNQYQRQGHQNNHPQQAFPIYQGNQQQDIYFLIQKINTMEQNQKKLKDKMKSMKEEINQLRVIVDDQGSQSHKKVLNAQNKNDQFINKAEYFQFKNWATQVINNMKQQLEKMPANQNVNIYKKHQFPQDTIINIGATKVSTTNQVENEQIYDIKSQKTNQNIPSVQQTKAAQKPLAKPTKNPPVKTHLPGNPNMHYPNVQYQQNGVQHGHNKMQYNQPAFTPQSHEAKKPQTMISVKQTLIEHLQQRAVSTGGKVQEMYIQVKEQIQNMQDAMISRKYNISTREQAIQCVKNMKFSWFDADDDQIKTEAELGATAIFAPGLKRWGLQIAMPKGAIENMPLGIWNQVFKAMGKDSLFRCVLKGDYNFAVIRSITTGEIYLTTDFSEEWLMDYEEELLNVPCDVLVHDVSAHVGLSYLSVENLAYYHEDGELSFTLNEPQQLLTCYLENVMIENIDECSNLVSITSYNSHQYDEVETLPAILHYYWHQ